MNFAVNARPYLYRAIEGGGIALPDDAILLTNDGVNYYWSIECPQDYYSLGDIVTASPVKPNVDRLVCVNKLFLVRANYGKTVW